jgi:signal transduction histidine kinase
MVRYYSSFILHFMPLTIRQYVHTLSRKDILAFIVVFLAYFLTAKLGLYIYFTFETSPALIWPPVGIALAAVFLGGYRMWVPIFLAQILSTISIGSMEYLPVLLVISIGFTLQAVAGLYFLRYFKFEPSMTTLRSAIVLVGAAFVVTMIEPTIATAWQYAFNSLGVSPLLNWMRGWAGGIFSVLIFTPFITTWLARTRHTYTRNDRTEILAAFSVLIGITYFLFATTYLQPLGISIIFFLPAVLIWIALRLRPHWLALAIFLTSTLGMACSILARPTASPLSLQLVSNEVYLGLVAAIFFIFAAIVEERRAAYKTLKENNMRLDAALEKLSAEDQAKSDFIAILAHELRNPLAPIVSAHEWLALQPQTPSALEALRSAKENTQMIGRLLEDLLDTARIARQKLTLRREHLLLQDIITKAVESSSSFLQSREHKLRISLPSEKVFLDADPVRLKQILINLLNNSGKYTEPGGRIELSADVERNHIVIQVKDTGMGIESDMLTAIFEPFNRVPRADIMSTGLGIGLSLTKRLVEMHGGTIWAESEGAGKGSTLTVRLPVAQEQPAVAPAQSIPYSAASGTGMRILIIDDNEDAAVGLKKLLSYHGHILEAAHTGRDGLHIAKHFMPDIVLLDIGLPDMDGYEVARQMKSAGIDSLVAITGYGQENDREKARDAGFVEHLVKPVGINDVITVLGALQKSPTGAL